MLSTGLRRTDFATRATTNDRIVAGYCSAVTAISPPEPPQGFHFHWQDKSQAANGEETNRLHQRFPEQYRSVIWLCTITFDQAVRLRFCIRGISNFICIHCQEPILQWPWVCDVLHLTTFAFNCYTISYLSSWDVLRRFTTYSNHYVIIRRTAKYWGTCFLHQAHL